MSIQNVGVVGAGVMGVGVAQSLAQSGHRAIVVDIAPAILQRAERELRRSLRFTRLYAKQKPDESDEAVLERVTFSDDYRALEKVHFVIENATEKWAVKSQIYPRLDEICPREAVFAVDTSCYSITRIAALTNRPSQVLGIHFMNPVPLKPTVEMIRGYHTSEEALDTARELLRRMGKSAVVVNDAPGFVSNRVLMLAINEAFFLLQDGVAGPEAVDRIFRECFGHKMGPIETAELIGLDTILYSVEVLFESFRDGKYRPCPLLEKMVHAGFLGRKNGRGVAAYLAGVVEATIGE